MHKVQKFIAMSLVGLCIIALVLSSYGSYMFFLYGDTENGWIIGFYLFPLYILTGILIMSICYIAFLSFGKSHKVLRGIATLCFIWSVGLILFGIATPYLRPIIATQTWVENNLYDISGNIRDKMRNSNNDMPASLSDIGYGAAVSNKITYTANTEPREFVDNANPNRNYYIYYYTLCTTFKSDTTVPNDPEQISRQAKGIDSAGYKISPNGYSQYYEFETHAKGRTCYKIKTQ